MKIGTVRIVNGGLFPTVAIEIRRTRLGAQAVEALLDSGFDGALSLPPEYVEALQLLLMTERVVTLGDGSDVNVKVHVGYVRVAGQTPGKIVLKMRIVKIDGGNLGFGGTLVREVLVKFILIVVIPAIVQLLAIPALFGTYPLVLILLLALFIWIYVDSKNQTLQDKIARTYVVKV